MSFRRSLVVLSLSVVTACAAAPRATSPATPAACAADRALASAYQARADRLAGGKGTYTAQTQADWHAARAGACR